MSFSINYRNKDVLLRINRKLDSVGFTCDYYVNNQKALSLDCDKNDYESASKYFHDDKNLTKVISNTFLSKYSGTNANSGLYRDVDHVLEVIDEIRGH